ncbi:MAG: hypothetical protein PHI36_06370 [Bacteroidales bacterium]|nr:hypothetical protein [Bacteroidales bacterium]
MDQIIDYSKFRCDIYSSKGKYITKALINKANLFYCPSLIVGQDYYIVFSYDNILLQVFLFSPYQGGKVMYISPSEIIFGHTPIDLPKEVLKAIEPLQKKSDDFQIPIMSWANIAYDTYSVSANDKDKKKKCKKKKGSFKVGNELSGQVK